MKKSRKQKTRKQKTRKQKTRKQKTRKQKGGDICEKKYILTEIHNSLAKYNHESIFEKEGKRTYYTNEDTLRERPEIITSLFEKIQKCDDIKSIESIIKRKKILSFYSSEAQKFYENLLEGFKNPTQKQEEGIIKNLEEYLESYKNYKDMDESYKKNTIDSLFDQIQKYDNNIIIDIIKNKKKWSYSSDAKEFYENILKKIEDNKPKDESESEANKPKSEIEKNTELDS